MTDKQKEVNFSESADIEYKNLQKLALEDLKKGLNSFNVQLLKAIKRIIVNLRIDPQFGVHIPRKNISKETIKRYNTDRLWKADLVGYWRLIYTLYGDEVKIISIILEFMNHDKYNKIFGYSGI